MTSVLDTSTTGAQREDPTGVLGHDPFLGPQLAQVAPRLHDRRTRAAFESRAHRAQQSDEQRRAADRDADLDDDDDGPGVRSSRDRQYDQQRDEPVSEIAVHAAVLDRAGPFTPRPHVPDDRLIDPVVDTVDDSGVDTDRVDVPARLGGVSDVDVVVGMQHVVEDSLQRLSERGRGVFHARRLQHATTTPVLGATSNSGRAERPSHAHDHHGADQQPDRDPHRRHDAANAGEVELGSAADRNGSARSPPRRPRGQSRS